MGETVFNLLDLWNSPYHSILQDVHILGWIICQITEPGKIFLERGKSKPFAKARYKSNTGWKWLERQNEHFLVNKTAVRQSTDSIHICYYITRYVVIMNHGMFMFVLVPVWLRNANNNIVLIFQHPELLLAWHLLPCCLTFPTLKSSNL